MNRANRQRWAGRGPQGQGREAPAEGARPVASITSGMDLLYGRQPAMECLRAGRRAVRSLYVAASVRQTPDIGGLLEAAGRAGAAVQTAETPFLDQLCAGGNHQGVALECGSYPYVDLDPAGLKPSPDTPAPLVLLLDHVQDPQNLGAILRTAEGAGVRTVVIPSDRAVGVTPTVVRASAGASEHLRVARVTNLVRAMQELKASEYWIAGLEAMPEAKLCWEQDLGGPLALVIGSEGAGLGRLVRETCDFLIRLPMAGRVASYNAGVAAAMAIYEVVRQRVSPVRAAAGRSSGSSR